MIAFNAAKTLFRKLFSKTPAPVAHYKEVFNTPVPPPVEKVLKKHDRPFTHGAFGKTRKFVLLNGQIWESHNKSIPAGYTF